MKTYLVYFWFYHLPPEDPDGAGHAYCVTPVDNRIMRAETPSEAIFAVKANFSPTLQAVMGCSYTKLTDFVIPPEA